MKRIGLACVLCLLATSPLYGAIGFTWKIAGNPNVPTMTLTNDSTMGEQILGYSVTIGDTSRNWDFSVLERFDSDLFTATLLSPDAANEGVRSDVLEYRFTGFGAGQTFRHAGDVDTDDPLQNVLQDYSTVLYNNGAAPNALVSVEFDNSSTLTRTLPNFDPFGPTVVSVHEPDPVPRQASATASMPEPSMLAIWSVLAAFAALVRTGGRSR